MANYKSSGTPAGGMEKGRDQAGSLKLAAYSISKWPIGAPAVISSVCRCSRNQIQRAVAFLINFLFRKHENSPLGKVHPARVPSTSRRFLFPSLRASCLWKEGGGEKRGKRNARNSHGRGDSRTMPEKQMREDQSAPRAHRTRLIIFMTLRHGRGVVREMRYLLPCRRRVTNLHRERERSDPPPATDNDLPPRDWNTSCCLLFRVVLTLLLTATIDDSAN